MTIYSKRERETRWIAKTITEKEGGRDINMKKRVSRMKKEKEETRKKEQGKE